jgi:hypothetical protein
MAATDHGHDYAFCNAMRQIGTCKGGVVVASAERVVTHGRNASRSQSRLLQHHTRASFLRGATARARAYVHQVVVSLTATMKGVQHSMAQHYSSWQFIFTITNLVGWHAPLHHVPQQRQRRYPLADARAGVDGAAQRRRRRRQRRCRHTMPRSQLAHGRASS